jgi:hypothetical protein
MKLLTENSLRQPPTRTAVVHAFTLAEIMTTMGVFSLVVLAMVSLQVFGFKMNSFTSSKLKFTTDSLKTLGHIRDQIRGATNAANAVLIGNFNISNSKFTAATNGALEIGNAVQISNNPINLVVFYLNASNSVLYELDIFRQPMALAHSVINLQPFQAEDFQGNTNKVGNLKYSTIKTTLLFSNFNYSAKGSNIYDIYQMETRATPRGQF